ncbi:U3 small nucleolar RNA-associated protein [Hysterangium stoloniferum]|nr:U3 small nucleolar RNA-associated protein [Hysterangium stoloniferum]
MSPIASSSKTTVASAFRKGRVIASLHTGGPFAVSHDARRIVTCVQDEVVLTDIESGIEICRFEGDSTPVTSLCMSPTSKHLIIFTSSNSLRIYDVTTTSTPLERPISPTRHIPKAHDAPVHVAIIDSWSAHIASGSADGIVKVWDLHRGYVTHVFKGHGGVVSALAFHRRSPKEVSQTAALTLFTASVDTRIRIFNLASSRSDASKPDLLLEGHVSVPRGLAVSSDGKWLVSGGRDSVVLVWNLLASGTTRGSIVPVKTIPTLERVETLGIIADIFQDSKPDASPLKIYTGGEHGVIKIWDVWAGKVVASMSPPHSYEESADSDAEEQKEIVDAIYLPADDMVVTLHADQNILFHSVLTHSLVRQLVGFNDEITDATLLQYSASLQSSSHLALSTNSSLIRIYSTDKHDARLLSGHASIVLSLDRGHGGTTFASGSKDHTARIWAYGHSGAKSPNNRWGCVAVCEGHTESVGAVAMSRKPTDNGRLRFLFTGSQDRTIKMWDISSVPNVFDLSSQHDPRKPHSLTTHSAHDKDINSLDVSHNDLLLASGSQDKTAKIFEIKYLVSSSGAVHGEMRLLGVCKGHRRGVWNVRFSKTDRILASGSGDKTIKLWCLDDFSCLKTFEGHTNSVLRVEFLNAGQRLLSSASDGLVKLWDVRTEECVMTLDNHEDKIWGLDVDVDEKTVVSASADSIVTFWQDSTEELSLENEKKREQMALREQDFTNYVALNDYRNAILLALTMDHPGRLLTLFHSVQSSVAAWKSGQSESTGITGHHAVDEVLRTLPLPSLAKLLGHLLTWNATARTSNIAQIVLHAVLKLRTANDIAMAFDSPGDGIPRPPKSDSLSPSLTDFVDSIIPYTERHLVRVEKLVQDSWVVDFVLGEMGGEVFENTGNNEASNDYMDIDEVNC